MKNFILSATCLCLLGVAIDASAQDQRKCGFDAIMNAAVANDPSFSEKFHQKLETRKQMIADFISNEESSASKTTAAPVIPVVFHIILSQQRITQLGGTAGITKRVDSSIAVINRDFNRKNADSTLIPAAFKPVYGNMNISFGLARRKPNGQATYGYEIRTITTDNFTGVGQGYSAAKYATNGLAAWDPNKYLNVWVIYTSDMPGLLGVTTPPGFGFPEAEEGIVLNYGAFGKRSTMSEFYFGGIDKGRTLTHELGHFFEVWHVWGDDGGSCSQDDGINDTPLQGGPTYSDYFPSYPELDNCSTSSPGIMFMNFMDYVDDAEMVMFTKQQAIAANASLTSESNGLTQHPEILQWPTDVAHIEVDNPFDIYPNPNSGNFNVTFTNNTEKLQNITVVNTVGQKVYEVATDKNTTIYNIDISGMSKGVYFVQCRFEEGMVTRKIVLQ